ncbi:MAG: nitrate ABC transporter permease [Chloroflexota bacterium]
MRQIIISRPAAPSLSLPGVAQFRVIGRKILGGLTTGAAALLLILALWSLAAWASGADLPGPAQTLATFWGLVSNPFYDKGPNDKGIGLQLMASLGRVGIGFGLASLVAIPLGIAMGITPGVHRIINPLVQVLRPVSPLAWFPIGLATLHSAQPATIFVIFMTALWPTIINTAFGVASIPNDHKNVARVFCFSRWKYIQKVVLPYSLPHMLTGLRLSMGIAWMVIVAAEMLAGGVGLGFFVWDSWNALKVDRIISAILIIGIVGLLLDRLFDLAAHKAAYEG